MRKFKSATFLLFVLFLLSCSTWHLTSKAADHSRFIRVQGTQFFLNGRPYYFLGTNYWYGCYLGLTLECGDRARLLRELDTLKAYGITNLRVLAASEESALQRSLRPAIPLRKNRA